MSVSRVKLRGMGNQPGRPSSSPHARELCYVLDLADGRVVDDGRYDKLESACARADEYNRCTRRTCGVFVLVAAYQD